MSKKSQITIFIILGIVILMVLAFLFYIRSQTVSTVSEANVRQTVDSILINTPVKLYVESCLDKATKDGLVLIGKQGGRIYDYQIQGTTRFLGSINTLQFEENNVVYNVSYAIYKSKENPPDYPYPKSLNPDDSSRAFGKPSILELCDNQGLNTWNLPDAKYSCIQYDPVGSEHSIQEYLEKYIEKKTKECVDITTLTSDLGYDIEEGDISAQVLFGDTDVLATINYEIIISTRERATLTKLLEFSVNPQVRLKKVYELAYYMIQEETNNIFFNMTDNETLIAMTKCPSANRKKFNESCLKQGMEVKQIRDVCPSCPGPLYSYVIQIRDNRSLINGKPYLFQFAVKNRAPALDYIDWPVDNKWPYYWYLQENIGSGYTPFSLYSKTTSSCPDCNIIVKAGQNIEIYPYGIDPDGDDLTYKYTGWKTPTPIIIGGILEGGGSYNWWENNYLYYGNRRDAIVYTNDSDAGVPYHFVRINISDTQGLTDYQDIKIKVKSP